MNNIYFMDQTGRSLKRLSISLIDQINQYRISELLIEKMDEDVESSEVNSSNFFPSSLNALKHLIEDVIKDTDIIYYVPDIEDARADARMRLFDDWVSKLEINERVQIVKKRYSIEDGRELIFIGFFVKNDRSDDIEHELLKWFDLLMGE